MKLCIKFTVCIFLLVFNAINNLCFSQTEITKLHYDTLSIKSILMMEYNINYPKIPIDSISIDLYLKKEKIASLPYSVFKLINQKQIISMDSHTEILADNKLFFCIKMFIRPSLESK